ncbi:2,4-dienoyl-coa reductase [hydrocarbon metagenome]|uniref:2,4-dienoyl-coa reductase n=1 Tax=hydrocarbon metagenome TaxID=938273 RepID=A0A0W8E454_9ZZZZ
MFNTLFSPIEINRTEIKNRIVYPSLNLLYSADHKLTDRHKAFFIERARGGAGIVTVGPVGVGELGSGRAVLAITSDEDIRSFRELVKSIQGRGARAWIQFYHAGAYLHPHQVGGQQPIAPSPIYNTYSKVTPREMTIEDINNVQKAYLRCAERAKEAGFDGVEIIASAGYLISQFLSPLRNKRTDEYGGSVDNRVRFVKEIIEQMRQNLGSNYPITIRMSGNDFVTGSNTGIDTPAFAEVYDRAGIDAINVTGGWHESRVPQITMDLPRGGFTYLAQSIKEIVNIPVIASNRISDPQTAEKILRDGCADMVSLGRVLLADPYWPLKAVYGKSEQICPCVACSQGCMDELFSSRPVMCMVNPRTGFEGTRKITVTSNPKRVMVIGAGPGGLEAAWRAARAGHLVELFEKADRIGGQLWIAGTPPHKQELWQLIRYYQAMLNLYQVQVFLNTTVDIETVRQRNPEYVIAAEGAEILLPAIEGIDGQEVISAWHLLKNNIPLGRRVAVIGGGAVGLETAHFVASKGTIAPETLHFLFTHEAESPERLRQLLFKGNKEVTVFEKMPRAGKGIGKSSRWGLMNSLKNYGVNIITQAKVCSIKDGTLTFEVDGEHRSATFDIIINATGSRPIRKVADALEETGIPFSVIGDSFSIGHITQAIHQAYLVVKDDL